MKQKFSSLYVGRLAIDHLFALNKSTLDIARPVIESIGGIPQSVFAGLDATTEAMGLQMNKATKSALTAKLAEMDEDRDDRFSEIKRHVTTHLVGRDPLKNEAAQNLKIFLDPYWESNDQAMNTQTNVLAELFGKFNGNDKLKADAALISIMDMMSGLETANSNFATVYQERNSIDAAESGPSASSLKTAAAKSYEELCVAVEMAVNYSPSDTLTTLFHEMDELRKTYAKIQHRKDKKEDPAQPA